MQIRKLDGSLLSIERKRIRGTDLSACDLTGADLSLLDMTFCRFLGSNLNGADLSGAKLAGAIFSNSDLSGANLQNADLCAAQLTLCLIDGTNFSGASLASATFGMNQIQATPPIFEAATWDGKPLGGYSIGAFGDKEKSFRHDLLRVKDTHPDPLVRRFIAANRAMLETYKLQALSAELAKSSEKGAEATETARRLAHLFAEIADEARTEQP